MANLQLRCSCGNMFVVDAAQLGKSGRTQCPRCLRPVLLDGPSPVAPPRKTARVLTAAPDSSRMRMWVMVLGAGAVVVVGLIVILVFVTGGDPPGRDVSSSPIYMDPLAQERHARPRVSDPPPPPPPSDVRAPGSLNVVGSAAQPAVAPSAAPSAAPGAAPASPPVPVGSAIQPGAAPPPAAALPAELLQQARNDILGLHPFYQGLALAKEELARVEHLAKTGTGSADDVAFLQGLLAGKAKVARDERVLLLESLEKLQKEALEGLPVDRLVLADGRVMTGRIMEETPESVKIERKTGAGVGGLMNFKRETLKSVEKGRGPGGEFKTRWEKAQKGAVSELVALAAWCREGGLTLQLQLVATKILTADPGHAASRTDLGLAANPVARAVEAEKQGGFITHLGRQWTAKELKDKLIRDGYFLQDGQWYQRKERMITVPGLFKYDRQTDKPVIISGNVPISHDQAIAYSMSQEVSSGSFVEKEEIKLLRRFYSPSLQVNTVINSTLPTYGGPGLDLQHKTDKPVPEIGTAMSGEVFITVPVGEPIIEASVTTHAEVKPGGSITVFMIHNAERIRLYQCGSKEDSSHKLPDQVRGKSQVDLVAVVTQKAAFTPKAERRRARGPKKDARGNIIQNALDVIHARLIPDYQAMLFPSNSNTIEVFRLRVTTGDAVPGITKLFQNAPPELLKNP